MMHFSNDRSRRPTTRKILGNHAERTARVYLERNGLRLLTRNYRCRFGEIDLVMHDADCIVFVEVRCRSAATFTPPALTVDANKQMRMSQTALSYLSARPALADEPVRFDVVAIEGTGHGPGAIQWIRDAFRS